MNTLLQAIGHCLVDYYLLSSLLLLVGLPAVALMRQPARKLAVMRAIVLGLFPLAVLCALPDWSMLHLARAKPALAPAPGSSVEVPVSVDPVGIPSSPSAVGRDTLSATSTSTKASAEPGDSVPIGGSEATTVVAQQQQQVSGNRWQPVALCGSIFLAGTLLAAIWLMLGARQLSRLVRESECAPTRVVDLLEKIAGPVARLPRLLVNRRLPSAVALGAWEATILIPGALAEEDRDTGELSSVLAHEWAHIRNGDLRLLAATRLLMLLLWAHPLYWMLRVRVRLEQEILADAAAAELTNRHDYAAQLVDWAKHMPPAAHRSIASAIGIWEGPSQLRRRVAVLLDDKLSVLRECSRRWRWFAGTACTMLAVGLSLVTLRPVSAAKDVEKAREGISDDQRIRGVWEIVSVEGSGGRLMDLSEESRPGDRITITHVRRGSDFKGPDVVDWKSPFEPRWMTTHTELGCLRDDYLYVHPQCEPKRLTYRIPDGKRTHFPDDSNPPNFAIYRFDGDRLTLNIGDPEDFVIDQEGQETIKIPAGTETIFKWKLVDSNYPTEFKLEPKMRQLLVTLKWVGEDPVDANAHAVLKEFNEAIEASSGEAFGKEGKKVWVHAWLRRLLGALDGAKDRELRKSLAIAALGYANSLSEYETSVKLLEELAKLESGKVRAADWNAELGGVFERMAAANPSAAEEYLERARAAYGKVFWTLNGRREPVGEYSPRAFHRLIMTFAEDGQVAEQLQDLESAADIYRRGDQYIEALRSAVKSGKAPPSDEGGHGGDPQTYAQVLEGLQRFGYHDQWFEYKELLVCAKTLDDARARELIAKLKKGSAPRRQTAMQSITRYAKQRYGITEPSEIAAILGGAKPEPKAADQPDDEAGAEVIATVLGVKITAQEKAQLQEKIFGPLFEKFATESQIEVSEEEIADYARWQDEITKWLHEKHKRDRASLLDELQSEALSEKQREQKQSHLESLEYILKSSREQKELELAQGEEGKKANRLGMAKTYSGQIRRWKTNQAFFEKYGGRVLFQQFGIEPIDAYRDYLREQETAGTFKLIDKRYEGQLWNYFLKPIESFLQSEEKAKEFFSTPPWTKKPGDLTPSD